MAAVARLRMAMGVFAACDASFDGYIATLPDGYLPASELIVSRDPPEEATTLAGALLEEGASMRVSTVGMP